MVQCTLNPVPSSLDQTLPVTTVYLPHSLCQCGAGT